MVDSKTIRHMMSNPKALMDFQATGKAPALASPRSPLITLLQSIHPSERRLITAVKISRELGYSGATSFQNAAQALSWLVPAYSATHYPSESHQDRRFARVLTIDDLAKFAHVPDVVRDSWWRRNEAMRPRQHERDFSPQ